MRKSSLLAAGLIVTVGLTVGLWVCCSDVASGARPPDAVQQTPTILHPQAWEHPPVIFIHGWNGLGGCSEVEPDGYFGSVDEWIAEAGYFVGYARLKSSTCYTPSLLGNVAYLKEAIDAAKAATGHAQVILVAHSMGGLVARAYIEGPAYAGDVRELFTFGAPHQGIPTNVLVYLVRSRSLGALCAIYQAVLCELSEEGARVFNMLFHPRRDVVYHLIAGDPHDGSRRLLGRLTSWLIPGGDDGIVSVASGVGLPGAMDRTLTFEAHNLAMGASTYFWRMGGKAYSFTECLGRVLIEQESASCGRLSTTLDLPMPETPSMHTPAYFGAVAPGAAVTHTLTVPGGVTRFGGYWLRALPSLTLIAPDGQVLDSYYAAANPHKVTLHMDGYATIYAISEAMPGQWQAVVRLHEGAPSQAEYALLAAFEGDTTLAAQVSAASARIGEPVVITAALTPPATAEVSAQLLRADGRVDALALSPAGAGVYTAAYSAQVVGYVDVRLHAAGISALGAPFDLGASLLFGVASGTFALVGEVRERVDSDPATVDPGFSDLLLEVSVQAEREGAVLLAGDLVDSGGALAAHAVTAATVAPGRQTVILRFAGRDLCADGRAGGVYTLANLLLVEARGSLQAADLATNSYHTADYPCAHLQHMQLFFPHIAR